MGLFEKWVAVVVATIILAPVIAWVAIEYKDLLTSLLHNLSDPG
jgi:hypothetical protein